MVKQKIVIVIPIYKVKLNFIEQISLAQVHSVLKNYDICYVTYRELDVSGYQVDDNTIFCYFHKDYFISKERYSELLLSAMFYEKFESYSYMLIYQLDALVFKDTLIKFCNMGYDYIGAVVHNKYWRAAGCSVGNGGLSLRKISSCLRMCKRKEYILSKVPTKCDKTVILETEDLFFSFAATIPENNFRTPSKKIATEFSIGGNIERLLNRLDGNLPFGWHDIPPLDYWLIRPIIENYGHKLPRRHGADIMISSRQLRIERYTISRLSRKSSYMEFSNCIESFKKDKDKVSIWGCGYYGQECLRVLNCLGICAYKLYDERQVVLEGRKSIAPSKCFPGKDEFVIITPIDFDVQQEICDVMLEHGRSLSVDFISWREIVQLVTIATWKKILNGLTHNAESI